jgi:hypothetical protein
MVSWRLTALTSGSTKAGAALLPAPSYDAGAYTSRGVVNGSPGTTMIPAPYPAAVPQDYSRRLHGSQDAPPAWFPGIYYAPRLESHFPGSYLSDNQMPVPAIDPRGTPGVVMPGPVMLESFQVANPRVAPKFMDRSKDPRIRRG